MKIALVGTGNMGRAVAAVAEERGHEIVARFDETQPLVEEDEAPEEADVAIDFTLPDVALDHIQRYCAWQQPAVVGTTGWYDELERVREWVEGSDASLLFAPNFSLGVALLKRALRGLLPLLNRVEEYDAFIHEIHHTEKVDSPSGTARMLGELLVEGLDRKKQLETETQHKRIDPKALHVTSTRAGQVFGRHTVGLDSAFDRLSFTHEAYGREGFALGAVRAAEWLEGRTGLFTLDDMLAEQLSA